MSNLISKEQAEELVLIDIAFNRAVRKNDIPTAQQVLRAWGYKFNKEAAEYAINFGYHELQRIAATQV